MTEVLVAIPAPVLVFDGDCGICQRAVLRLEAIAGDRVRCEPYQESALVDHVDGLTAERCAQAVHLVEPDRRVTRGAEACFRALAHAPGKAWARRVYRWPGVAALTERGYAWIARYRMGVSRVNRLLSGPDPAPSTYGTGRRLFLALLGLAFLVSFASFGVQAFALIGSGGVLPLQRMIAWDAHVMPNALMEMPSVFWFAHGDVALALVLLVGGLATLVLTVGLWPRLSLGIAWVCWLSLTALAFPPAGPEYLGNVFLGYSWDALLVEAGLLGMFVAPRGLLGRWREPPSTAGLLLLRLLLIRVVLGEVLVRHTSGDPTWAEPGALGLHLWTQPLPTWIGALVHEWGTEVQGFVLSLGDVLGLGLVWGLLGPRRLRALAVAAIVLSQIAGLMVGQLGVWPLAVVALAALAVDDQTWRKVLPGPAKRLVRPITWRAVPGYVQGARAIIAAVLIALAIHVSFGFFTGREPSVLQRALLPYQICNGYGPFPSVVLRRFALTLEGSDDGETWVQFELLSSPSGVYQPPPGPSLHLRRADWKLDDVAHRLAAGGQSPPWFNLMLVRLLDGALHARELFAPGPFQSAPPRALRVSVREFSPAGAEERREDGMWWYRWPGAVIGTPVMLQDGKLVPAHW